MVGVRRLVCLDGSFPSSDNAPMPQYVHPAAFPYEHGDSAAIRGYDMRTVGLMERRLCNATLVRLLPISNCLPNLVVHNILTWEDVMNPTKAGTLIS